MTLVNENSNSQSFEDQLNQLSNQVK